MKNHSIQANYYYYCSLCDLYPIRIIEDPFREDDLNSFAQITSRLGGKTCIVGDDIFVSHNTEYEKV